MKRLLYLFLICIYFSHVHGQFKEISLNEISAILCEDSTVTLKNSGGFSHGFTFGKVQGLDSVVSVSSGYYYNLYLRADSTVWAEGSNGHGQMATKEYIDSGYLPLRQLNGLSQIVKIVAGMHSCAAIDSRGDVWIWGLFYNDLNECVNWQGYPALCTPHKINIENVIDVSVNWGRILLLLKDGSVLQNKTTQAKVSVFDLKKVEGLEGIAQISCGSRTNFAIDSNGVLFKWSNFYNNDSLIIFDTGVEKVSAGWQYNIYLKTDNSLWQYNSTGDILTQIPFDYEISEIYASPLLLGVLTPNKEIWVWNIHSDFVPKIKYWICECKEQLLDSIVLDTVLIPNSDISLIASYNPSNKYDWNPTEGLSSTNINNPTVNISESTEYQVGLIDFYGCLIKNEVFLLNVRDCDTITSAIEVIKLDTTVLQDSAIILKPSPGYSYYEWEFSNGLSCITCENPTYISDVDEILSVKILDDWKCEHYEKFKIVISTELPDESPMIIPDIFTPNNDGINDFFEIVNLKSNTSLTIFNRDGQIVFSTQDYQNNWYGTNSNGQPLSQDNYFYVIKNIEKAGEIIGSVFIKR